MNQNIAGRAKRNSYEEVTTQGESFIIASSAVEMRLDCLNQLVRGKRFMDKAVSA